MCKDLRAVFGKYAESEREPIGVLVCDVFDTLVDTRSACLNKSLHDLLIVLKNDGAQVVIVSSEPRSAEAILRDAGCNSELLTEGVKDKATVQTKLFMTGQSYAAIDDMVLIWMDAAVAVGPKDKVLADYMAHKNIAPSGPSVSCH